MGGRKGRRSNKKYKKKGSNGNGSGSGEQGGGDNSNNSNKRRDYKITPKEKMSEMFNNRLAAYYSLQGLFDYSTTTNDNDALAERETFLNTMRTPLPSSFRIGADLPETLKQSLLSEMRDICGARREDMIKDIPFVKNAFQFKVLDRYTIRKDKDLSALHEWLKIQNGTGFITRQETVSMLPPAALDIKPDMLVLDMCAAPGSKTTQMLEQIVSSRADPPGVIVANDSDAKRAFMLTSQLRRINCPAVFVTSADAQFFPCIKLPQSCLSSHIQKDQLNGNGMTDEIYDRVLCDVPCSGDGTMRKNMMIWRNWNDKHGKGLHPVQLRIAERGLRLTRVGGLMCYSTCSLNPMENESVVCELLRRIGMDKIRLVNIHDGRFGGFKGRPGLKTWKVTLSHHQKRVRNSHEREEPDKDEDKSIASMEPTKASAEEVLDSKTEENDADKPVKEVEEKGEIDPTKFFKIYNNYSEIADDSNINNKLMKSLFPPTEAETKEMNIHYSMRVHPQDNDSGGFFVAIFEKIASIKTKKGKEEEEEEASVKEEQGDSNGEDEKSEPPEKKAKVENHPQRHVRGRKSRLIHGDLGSSDFLPLPEEALKEVWPEIQETYGFSADFPIDQIMSRSDNSEPKVLYFVTKTVKGSLMDNGFQDRLITISTGLKVFEKQSGRVGGTRYRLSQEGIHCIRKYLNLRKITVSIDDFRECLTKMMELFDENKQRKEKESNLTFMIRAPEDSEEKVSHNLSEEFVNKVLALSPGSFVVELEGADENMKMMMVMWRCVKAGFNFLVARDEMQAINSKLIAMER